MTRRSRADYAAILAQAVTDSDEISRAANEARAEATAEAQPEAGAIFPASLPAQTRVERKSTPDRRYARKRRVPHGAKGTTTGRAKLVESRRGTMREACEVVFDEPCNVHGGIPSQTWWCLVEHLIPLE